MQNTTKTLFKPLFAFKEYKRRFFIIIYYVVKEYMGYFFFYKVSTFNTLLAI